MLMVCRVYGAVLRGEQAVHPTHEVTLLGNLHVSMQQYDQQKQDKIKEGLCCRTSYVRACV